MWMTRILFAAAVLFAGSALAADENPADVSRVAGDFAGVAASCGLDTQAYSSRVEELLRHMAASSQEADELIANFNDKKKAAMTREDSERTIDCMDAKRRFEDLPINQPTWTVETGWAAEML